MKRAHSRLEAGGRRLSASPRHSRGARRPEGAARALQSRALKPARFEPQTGYWREGRFGVMPRPRKLRLVTWNIWFGEYRWLDRLDALLAEVEREQADLIALQEVTRRQLSRILETDWVRRDFAVSDAEGLSLDPHGVLLLARPSLQDLRLIGLPSRRHRKLIHAELDTACGPLQVVTAHLESGADAVALREAQLRIAGQVLGNGSAAVLLGDLNFDAERDPEEDHVPPGLIDCWRALRGDQAGNTLDPVENSMRAAMVEQTGARQPMRCDRILFRPDADHRWRPAAIRPIGTTPIDAADDLYASDHFGLLVEVGCG
jgi:endonuclease/exonuclease/phosphatase family metal-dependent hydrolase